MTTDKFQARLNASSGNNKIELFNAWPLYQAMKEEFEPDYIITDFNLYIEALDVATDIKALQVVPWAEYDDTDSKAARAKAVYENYVKYPKVGVQLYLDIGNGYQPQGQPVVFQNLAYQIPVSILSPHLISSTNNVDLFGKKTRIAVQVVPDPTGNTWKQLSGNDYLLIRGSYRTEVQLKQRITKEVKNWVNFGVDVTANQLTILRPMNKSRRYLVLTNAGDTDAYVAFGETLITGQGALLKPGGSLSFSSEGYIVPNQVVAISQQSTRITGLEGLL